MKANGVIERINFLEESYSTCYETLRWTEFEYDRLFYEYQQLKKENRRLKNKLQHTQMDRPQALIKMIKKVG